MKTLAQQEMDLIVKEAGKLFKSERAFYNGRLPQRSWDRLKTGESDLSNVALKSYRSMTEILFTPYERMLLDRARGSMKYGQFKTLEDAYDHFKHKHASIMVENHASISVSGAYMVVSGNETRPGTELKVEDALGNVIKFFVNCTPAQVPSGKTNRKKWFEEEFHQVVQ